ncbi:MAG: hypothetical protein ACREJQ_07830, partial [bacterium]
VLAYLVSIVGAMGIAFAFQDLPGSLAFAIPAFGILWIIIGFVVAKGILSIRLRMGAPLSRTILREADFAIVFAALIPGWSFWWYSATRSLIPWAKHPDLVFMFTVAFILPYCIGGLLATRFRAGKR